MKSAASFQLLLVSASTGGFPIERILTITVTWQVLAGLSDLFVPECNVEIDAEQVPAHFSPIP